MKNLIKLTSLGLLMLICISYSCKKKEVPILITNEITNITSTSAKCGGIITDGGSSEVTARGVCWSTGHPTVADNITIDGIGAGSFTSIISGLNGASKYYVRAYATNSVGPAYGNEISFTTNSTFTGPIFYNNNGKIINAVCYGPFRDGQAPGSVLTETQIKEDLLIIKNHLD